MLVTVYGYEHVKLVTVCGYEHVMLVTVYGYEQNPSRSVGGAAHREVQI